MIHHNEQAHANLADALWWLAGFAASTGGNEAGELADKLREVRTYLDRIADGKIRRIGDERGVVLTYAEFERLVDAFPAHSEPAPAEVGHARETLHAILAEYQHEALSARNLPDVPF